MTYATPTPARIALEQRPVKQSNDSGISLDHLRRRIIFERVISRLEVADPCRWVLKGGLAVEGSVRLYPDWTNHARGKARRLTSGIQGRQPIHDSTNLEQACSGSSAVLG